jgi:hypothetical protein
VYNGAYINKWVLFDVLSTILKRFFVDGVLYMLIYMSLMWDPYTLIQVPNDVLTTLPPDLDITALE